MYEFKEEFCKELNIPQNQPNRRKEELLAWLTNFYDFEMIEGRPLRILIKEVIGDYQPLPRKAPSQKELTEQKIRDYDNFVIKNLPKELQPMSKARMAKNAIDSFGNKKYSHSSVKSVANRYVGPAMEEHGIKTDQRFWCWLKTYEVLDDATVEDWRNILSKWKCTEKEVYNAFCKKQTLNDDEELVKLEGAFRSALLEFKSKYGDGVVLVPKWRIASAAEKAQKQSKE
jgi:hypothetical protein